MNFVQEISLSGTARRRGAISGIPSAILGNHVNHELVDLSIAAEINPDLDLPSGRRTVGGSHASPRVELRLGEGKDAVESEEAARVIHMRHWNRALFKRTALMVCMREVEFDIVPQLFDEVRDY
jgi:hypothetical protein